MKKRDRKMNVMFLLAIFLMIASIGKTDVSALASNTQATNQTEQAGDSSADQQKGITGNRLADEAGLLTEEEASSLSETLDTISESQACDVVIVTVDSLDGKTAEAYADDFFDYNGYGQGEERDGILFLISMEEHDWAISTRGFAITAFTDAGQSYMTDQFLAYISDGDYAKGLEEYADLCDQFLTQAKTGEAYDTGNLPKGSVSIFWLPIDIVIGFVIAFFIALGKKKTLKTVRSKVSAKDYTVPGSLKVTGSYEHLINRVTSSRTISNSSSDSSGGGSSTHTSSSGATHGGSSGKF